VVREVAVSRLEGGGCILLSASHPEHNHQSKLSVDSVVTLPQTIDVDMMRESLVT
jgi:hypothetical protein